MTQTINASEITTGQTIEFTSRQETRRLTVTETYRMTGDLVQVNGADPDSANDERQVFLAANRTVQVIS